MIFPLSAGVYEFADGEKLTRVTLARLGRFAFAGDGKVCVST